jgi:acetyltransferase-like isoleucine patch superfamily enzyme
MRDIKGGVLRRLETCTSAVVRDVCGAATRADAWSRGVEIGEGCIFLGRTYFRRASHSRIRIGPRCEFRSAAWANEVGINRPCRVSTMRAGAEVRIGAGCGLSGTVIAAASLVEMGERVLCGANVTIMDSDAHGLAVDRRRTAPEPCPVSIGDDVWLGLNVIVLKGVAIGRGTVVAAGSVVVSDLPPGVVAAGQPAVVIGNVPDGERRTGDPS